MSNLTHHITEDDGTTDTWLPLAKVAKHSPYDAEYLSLLARRQKLVAKKIDGIWYTTRVALAEYVLETQKSQKRNKERLRNILTVSPENSDEDVVQDSNTVQSSELSNSVLGKQADQAIFRFKTRVVRKIPHIAIYAASFFLALSIGLLLVNHGLQKRNESFVISTDTSSSGYVADSVSNNPKLFKRSLSQTGTPSLLASASDASSDFFDALFSFFFFTKHITSNTSQDSKKNQTSALRTLTPVWDTSVSRASTPVAQAPIHNYYGPVTNNYGAVTKTENYYVGSPGVSPEVLSTELQILKNNVLSQMYGEISNIASNVSGNTQTIQLSNRIDQLASVNISGSTFTGGTISNTTITGSNISGGTGSFSTLSVSGATQLSSLTASGDTTLATTTISGPFTLISSVTSMTENGPLQVNNGVVSATTSIGTLYGGTGLNSYTTGDILYASSENTLSRLGIGSSGKVLKVQGGVPVWGADISGGGGAGAWATSTDSLSISPADISNVIIIGASATSTTGNIFETVGNSLFRGSLTAYNSVTAPYFTATTTTASTFPYASTTALTVSGNTFLTGLTGSNALAINAAGQIYSAATS
ncbi:hypothetical protein EPO56_00760, partial [Patescibacteria group bacterium]